MKDSEAVRPSNEVSVHLRDYWRIVWDNRWMVTAVFVAVIVVVALATFLTTPVYRAEATVEIQARAKRIAPVADVASPGVSDYSWFAEDRYFNTQFEIIKSRSVTERVFERIDLAQRPRFADQADPIQAFIRLIHVEPKADTGIVRVSMEGTDPKEITRWVNALVEAYVDRNLDLAVAETRRAVNALLQEMEPLRARLQQTDEARFEFAERTSLYVPEDYTKTLDERLKELEKQQTEARVKRLEIEAVFNKIEEIERDGGSFLSLPGVNGDPTIRRMNDEYIHHEKELNRLLISFRPSHPRVIEKRSEMEKVRQQMIDESNQIINAVRTEYALNRDRETRMAREIERTKEESLRTRQKASSYQTLASDATETRRLFDLFNSRVKEISVNTELLSNNIRILDRAVVPQAPVRPNKTGNLLVGVLLGLGLGVGAAFFLDYLDNTVKSADEIERVLNLNTLAVVPRATDETVNATREALQTLRTSLLFSSRNRTDRVLLVTSTGPREGKTTTAINLARTLAAAGDTVCIVDCDLRRPAVHTRLNLSRHNGLTHFLMSADEMSWRSYIKGTDIPKVDAITCGTLPPNPPQVFGNERFIRLLQTLKANYDWVLADSPPVGTLTDSIILASLVDMVLMVIRYQQTDREVIKRAANGLRNVSANLVGAVLNDVDPERSHYKSYYDYDYYLTREEPQSAEGRETKHTEGEEARPRVV